MGLEGQQARHCSRSDLKDLRPGRKRASLELLLGLPSMGITMREELAVGPGGRFGRVLQAIWVCTVPISIPTCRE